MSYIAVNVLSMQMNFSEKSKRSLLGHIQGTISIRYGIQTVVRSVRTLVRIVVVVLFYVFKRPKAA